MNAPGRIAPCNRKRKLPSTASTILATVVVVPMLLAGLGAIDIRVTEQWASGFSAAAGVASLGLLTLALVLGTTISVARAVGSRVLPLVRQVHQTIAAITAIIVVLHLWAALSIPFFSLNPWSVITPVQFEDGSIRFTSYGAIAFDVLLVVMAATTLDKTAGFVMRQRHRSLRTMVWRLWRAIHWAVYPLWTVASVHVWMVPTRTSQAHAYLLTYVFICTLFAGAATICRIGLHYRAKDSKRLTASLVLKESDRSNAGTRINGIPPPPMGFIPARELPRLSRRTRWNSDLPPAKGKGGVSPT